MARESGETWPAVYEKAFAKLKTGTGTDMPDITKTAWGDCVWATAQLNGGARNCWDTASRRADVVGSHCYTVLGWAYRDCRRWIVLRNPWGYFEATASVLDATISMYDVSWWRPITLKNVDGVFAMEIGAFKKYFAGFGTAY